MSILSTIGITVKVNSVEVNYVQEIGDVSSSASELDATCLTDTVKKTVPGIKENPVFEITYLFDNSSSESDFRRFKVIENAKSVVPVSVEFPDGTTCSNTAYLTTDIAAAKVDELIVAKLNCYLQSAWTFENP